MNSNRLYIPPQAQSYQKEGSDNKRTIIIITNPLHKDILETIKSFEDHQKKIEVKYVEFDELTNVLDVIVNAANVDKSFIITDANNNCSALQTSINGLTHRDKCKGIWAFPNNLNHGDVNEFMDKITLCTNNVVKKIEALIKQNEQEDLIVIPENKKGIAKYYALMALQQDPTHSMKDAIDKGYFDHNCLWYKEFEKWINNILND